MSAPLGLILTRRLEEFCLTTYQSLTGFVLVVRMPVPDRRSEDDGRIPVLDRFLVDDRLIPVPDRFRAELIATGDAGTGKRG